jgi:hypothetical protein
VVTTDASPNVTSPGLATSVPAPSAPADGIEPSEITGRLPRRVRQHNLAPQLRGRHAGERKPPEQEPLDDDDDPNPEFSRDLMTSLQSGWQRGRTSGENGDDDSHTEWERP